MISHKDISIIKEGFKDIKSKENVDAILAIDTRGYTYYNDGFPENNYQVHPLFRIARFFFAEDVESTVVAIEGEKTTTTIRITEEGDLLAMRENKKEG